MISQSTNMYSISPVCQHFAKYNTTLISKELTILMGRQIYNEFKHSIIFLKVRSITVKRLRKEGILMGVWTSKPNTYNRTNFIEIPEGDHRVQITRVSVERFREQKKCFEITMKVSGYHGKVWYYLWYNPENIEWGEKKFFCVLPVFSD